LDTLSFVLNNGSSAWMSEVNPDTTLDSILYFFTGDVNASGTTFVYLAYAEQPFKFSRAK